MKKGWRSFVVLSILFFCSTDPSLAQEGASRTKSFTVSKGDTLEVSAHVGNIRISTWDKNEVFVEAVDPDGEDLDGLRMAQRGRTVRVVYDPREAECDDIQFTINIPSHFNANLQTSGGDIAVKGTLTGYLEGETSGGDIRISDVTGSVDMSTGGGDIQAGDIDGDVTFTTSGGDIHIGTIGGAAEVTTSGGDIRIEGVAKALKAETSGGNVSIGDVVGLATVATSGGDIIAERLLGGASLETAGGNITLRSGVGVVSAKTAGGDIRIDSVSGAVEARTSAGDVEVALLPSSKGKSRISSSVGNVRLFLPSDTKATITARLRVGGGRKSRSDEWTIFSDFEGATYEKDEQGREIRATCHLNGGGQPISLETTLGSIEIRKLESHARPYYRERYKEKRKR